MRRKDFGDTVLYKAILIFYGVVTWIFLVLTLIHHDYFWAAVSALLICYLLAPEPKNKNYLGRGIPKMPVAVVGEPKRYDLKTLPPDGYVVIRRLSHGEKNVRRAMNSKMTMKATKGRKDVDTVIDAFNADVDAYNFKNCIVEHNCLDKDERLLNFANPADLAKLDGKVSEEIATYIDLENNFEDDDDLGNSSEPSEATS